MLIIVSLVDLQIFVSFSFIR